MRVVEMFGPTIQGEGPHAGRPCHFLRLGGCDYRCSWCDSMHAVEPARVREAPNLGPAEILRALGRLDPTGMLVISGGNPALHNLTELMPILHDRYRVVAVETQGSRWREWLGGVDSLVVSPKPPSSGEVSARNNQRFGAFMAQAGHQPGLVLKVVVFDSEDLEWARDVHLEWPEVPFYISCGTEPDDDPNDLGARYGWLCDRVAHDPAWHDAYVLPQLHVIAWGHRVGV